MYDDFKKHLRISGIVCLVLYIACLMPVSDERMLIPISIGFTALWLGYVWLVYKTAVEFDRARPVLERAITAIGADEGPPLRWRYTSSYLHLEADFAKRVVRLQSMSANYQIKRGSTKEDLLLSSEGVELPFETLSCWMRVLTTSRTSSTIETKREYEFIGGKLTGFDQGYVTGLNHMEGISGRADFWINCDTSPLKAVPQFPGAKTAKIEAAKGDYAKHTFTWSDIAAAHAERLKGVVTELIALITEYDKPRQEALFSEFITECRQEELMRPEKERQRKEIVLKLARKYLTTNGLKPDSKIEYRVLNNIETNLPSENSLKIDYESLFSWFIACDSNGRALIQGDFVDNDHRNKFAKFVGQVHGAKVERKRSIWDRRSEDNITELRPLEYALDIVIKNAASENGVQSLQVMGGSPIELIDEWVSRLNTAVHIN